MFRLSFAQGEEPSGLPLIPVAELSFFFFYNRHFGFDFMSHDLRFDYKNWLNATTLGD